MINQKNRVFLVIFVIHTYSKFMGKKLILITNDDGYRAKGIQSLIQFMKPLGEVIVVAPDGPRSGYSKAITSIDPLRVTLHEEDKDYKLYICNGTPVDCIKLGIGEILKGRTPDLVATGINHGANSAVSLLYSGTMGAAIEGCIKGIPSIGFSLLDHAADADFSFSEKYIQEIAQKVLDKGLPQWTCLNVNIPMGNDIKGIKVARQTLGGWVNEYKSATDGYGYPIYWLTGEFNDQDKQEDSDEAILAKNYVAVVPVKVDMTDHQYLDELEQLLK